MIKNKTTQALFPSSLLNYQQQQITTPAGFNYNPVRTPASTSNRNLFSNINAFNTTLHGSLTSRRLNTTQGNSTQQQEVVQAASNPLNNKLIAPPTKTNPINRNTHYTNKHIVTHSSPKSVNQLFTHPGKRPNNNIQPWNFSAINYVQAKNTYQNSPPIFAKSTTSINNNNLSHHLTTIIPRSGFQALEEKFPPTILNNKHPGVVQAASRSQPEMHIINFHGEEVMVPHGQEDKAAELVAKIESPRFGHVKLDSRGATDVMRKIIESNKKPVNEDLLARMRPVPWTMSELSSLHSTLESYSPLLGDERSAHPLKEFTGTPQHLKQISKVNFLLSDEGTHISSTNAGTVSALGSIVFTDHALSRPPRPEQGIKTATGDIATTVEQQFQWVADHEMAHMEVESDSNMRAFVTSAKYWAGPENAKLRLPKFAAEKYKPSTLYGAENPREDMSEAMAELLATGSLYEQSQPLRAAALRRLLPRIVDKRLASADRSGSAPRIERTEPLPEHFDTADGEDFVSAFDFINESRKKSTSSATLPTDIPDLFAGLTVYGPEPKSPRQRASSTHETSTDLFTGLTVHEPRPKSPKRDTLDTHEPTDLFAGMTIREPRPRSSRQKASSTHEATTDLFAGLTVHEPQPRSSKRDTPGTHEPTDLFAGMTVREPRPKNLKRRTSTTPIPQRRRSSSPHPSDK